MCETAGHQDGKQPRSAEQMAIPAAVPQQQKRDGHAHLLVRLDQPYLPHINM